MALIIKHIKTMETKDIIKITALVFSKKKTIAQVNREYQLAHGRELPIKSDLETLQAQLSLGKISGKSIKGGTFNMYLKDSPLVLSVLIMDKYKKILFTDIKGNSFIVNNPKWLYQYISLKNINTKPRIYEL